MSNQRLQEKQFSWGTIIRRLLPRLLINALLPFVLYRLTKHVYPSSDLYPLLVAALPPFVMTGVQFVRKRSIDLLGIGVLEGFALGALMLLIGADSRWLLLRESVVTGALGIACLVSLFFARPLMYWVLTYLSTGGSLSPAALSDTLWHQAPSVRSAFKVITLVLGIVLVLEVVIRAYLVFSLSIDISLLVLPILFHSLQLITLIWAVLYMRSAIRKGHEATPHVITAPLI